jgi:hypothetical protein
MKIVFKFCGGSRDGETDVGDTDRMPGNGNDAARHYWITHNGTVGKRFVIPKPYAMSELLEGRDGGGGEKYEVIERSEAGNEIVVRASFVGCLK